VNVFSEFNTGFQPYQHFTATVVGTGADLLVFTSANDPGFTYLDDVTLSVPEPATWSVMLAGLGLAGAALRRRRIAAA
jgi:hypothetical protein